MDMYVGPKRAGVIRGNFRTPHFVVRLCICTLYCIAPHVGDGCIEMRDSHTPLCHDISIAVCSVIGIVALSDLYCRLVHTWSCCLGERRLLRRPPEAPLCGGVWVRPCRWLGCGSRPPCRVVVVFPVSGAVYGYVPTAQRTTVQLFCVQTHENVDDSGLQEDATSTFGCA